MREFLQRGGRDMTGLDELSGRVQQRRRDLLSRHRLDGTLQQVRQLLMTRCWKNVSSWRGISAWMTPTATFGNATTEPTRLACSSGHRTLRYDWQSSTAQENSTRSKIYLAANF